ncbi:hypothetical protein [Nocardioides sp. KR10-350]|uniref:hypothetical protein n=1 Tax=Nocardioides cheoyonin TaxID=3156615 RepID=UPI0032B4F04F
MFTGHAPASTSIGTVLTQAALAAGPLPWAMAGMTIANPVVAYAAACVAFDADPPAVAVAVCALVLLVGGVVGLARSPSVGHWTPAQDRRRVGSQA